MRRFSQARQNTVAAPEAELQLNNDARYLRALAKLDVPGQRTPQAGPFTRPGGRSHDRHSGQTWHWLSYVVPIGSSNLEQTIHIETTEGQYSATTISWNHHTVLDLRVYWNRDLNDPAELLIVPAGDAEVVIAHNQLTRDDLAAHNPSIPVVGSASAVCRSTAEILPDYESLQRRLAAEPNDPTLQQQMGLYTMVLGEIQAGRMMPAEVDDRYALRAMLDQEVAAAAADLVDQHLTDLASSTGIQPRAWARPAP